MTTSFKKYSVLIADDHELILDGLKMVIKKFNCVRNVDSVKNKSELDLILNKNSFDVVFLDIHFGDHDGRDVAKEIKLKYPKIILAAFTSFDDKDTIQSTVHAGFNAFFLKSDAINEIENWLNKANFDTVYISEQTKTTYSDFVLITDIKQKHNISLSLKEKEMLRLILDEHTSKQIAEKLFLSEKTIENYRSNLMLKLGVTNIAGLVKKTILLGLLT